MLKRLSFWKGFCSIFNLFGEPLPPFRPTNAGTLADDAKNLSKDWYNGNYVTKDKYDEEYNEFI